MSGTERRPVPFIGRHQAGEAEQRLRLSGLLRPTGLETER
jgi:hypothetical protein